MKPTSLWHFLLSIAGSRRLKDERIPKAHVCLCVYWNNECLFTWAKTIAILLELERKPVLITGMEVLYLWSPDFLSPFTLVGTALRTHVGSLLQKEENDLHTYPTIIQDIQKQRDINLYKLVLDRCSNFHSTLSVWGKNRKNVGWGHRGLSRDRIEES
jgi:hypothetical protein